MQGAQQFHLHRRRHVTQLVEKQRPPVGELELAVSPLLVSPGIGARSHTKELRLQQGLGHRRHVHTHKRPPRPGRRGVDGVGQQLFTGTGLAQQQHRTAGLRCPASLPLDFEGSSRGAHKAGKGVFRAPLVGQLTARFTQVLLQTGKLRDQRLQRGFGVIKQHNPQHPDHLAIVIAKGYAADNKRACLVGEQVDQDRLARGQHLVHLGVLHHVGNRVAHEILFALKTQRWQESAVQVVDPDHARIAIHQHHPFAGVGEEVKHRPRSKFENALRVARKAVVTDHGGMVPRPRGCAPRSARCTIASN